MNKPLARKDNKGKVQMSRLFVDLSRELEQVAKILSDGADKYGAGNWQKGKPHKDFFTDALYRHSNESNRGVIDDKESGSPHKGHMIANLLFDLWYENNDRTN